MSGATTVAGYALLGVAVVGCQVLALVTGRIPTVGQAVSRLTRRRPGRWLVLGGWLWIGWHLFVLRWQEFFRT